MTAVVFDETACELGEGPLWHPERRQLFWFDILGRRLHSQEDGRTRTWGFEEMVSAAGWIDRTHLLIASETALFRFDLETGAREDLCALEADDLATRSNDGRADPWGGFWIGTMGKGAEPAAGSVYRYYRADLRCLHPGLTIPNAICFSPDRAFAYLADTATQTIQRQPLDPATGWPSGPATAWLDLSGEGLNPDGAVVAADGTLWCAQWGAARVAAYSPEGRFLDAVGFPAAHTSCPAFGGPDLSTLYCTSARQGLSADALAAEPRNGMTFAAPTRTTGQAEPRVILPD